MTKPNSNRETCDVCAKDITIIKTGVFRSHMDGDFRNGGQHCAGAGHAPHRVTEAVTATRAKWGDKLSFSQLRAHVRVYLHPSPSHPEHLENYEIPYPHH